MKKYLLGLVIVISCFLLVGCGEYGEKNVLKDLEKKISNSKAYHLTGILEMINNENSYIYDVEVSYRKDDNFRVSLINQTNNHEQIILKNENGVYVLTPSLNKSFKFQSEWPYNNSQAYLLQTILKDIKNDKKRTFKKSDDEYVFFTTVNYPNNKNLVKQKVILDKKVNLKEVQVLDENDNMQMKMTFEKIDLKATYDDNYFSLKENMESAIALEETVSKIDDIIYPLYIPENTTLASQNKITKADGERVILTFSGDKSFTFVQETISVSDDLVTIPMYGEPTVVGDTIGALSETSITWMSNGMEYYLTSKILTEDELVNIASSISTVPVMK
ncbi:MAG: outer membrane lipoprotein carrier protein LolA [Bacilli bacterium]|nr:outer membrane lipoprotein carrier protein LolA [Bacilli bacterium]MDD4607947.1 outer membrane lipoprotein carrier protein LolA [Bacilli bacterium]